MQSPNRDIFLNEILSYVKFAYDRNDIRIELENHISDKTEYYMEQGYDMKEAEQLSIKEMGDAKEIGIELNKQHNPILGWIWIITKIITTLLIIITCFIFVILLGTFFRSDLINNIPKSDIVYRIDLKKQVKIDDMVIQFTNVVLDKDGDMHIFYEYYNTRLFGSVWSLGSLGEITDNLGNKYMSGGGQANCGGIISKGVWIIDHFYKDADMLIISYDWYNRKYKVEIPLKEGDNDE